MAVGGKKKVKTSDCIYFIYLLIPVLMQTVCAIHGS